MKKFVSASSWRNVETASLSSTLTRKYYTTSNFTATAPWICSGCRRAAGRVSVEETGGKEYQARRSRSFTNTTRLRSDNISAATASRSSDELPKTPAATSPSLPSHTAKQQWTISRRASNIVDNLLARASLASQHINVYTGTDYSGIEALRKEIIEQEVKVREHHNTVTQAKDEYSEARAKQSSSQKEVVALLERKSSWQQSDVERYMSLVRSEHLDDQAVQKAGEDLAMAERDLESTRSLMEKLERKQYHEEQIWSDTIRRNSTWVTIGLMGVNILLLLAQISIFEPYRRKKIVRQIETALDERQQIAISTGTSSIESQIDAVVEPTVPLEVLEFAEAQMQEISEADLLSAAPPTTRSSTPFFHDPKAELFDLFSDRVINITMLDLTSSALAGVVAGLSMAAVGYLTMMRP